MKYEKVDTKSNIREDEKVKPIIMLVNASSLKQKTNITHQSTDLLSVLPTATSYVKLSHPN